MSPKYNEAERLRDLRELVERGDREFGDKVVFRDLDSSGTIHDHSFRELRQDVAALGTALLDRGLSGRHIALIGESSYGYVICYLAAVTSGAIVVPIDQELTKDEMVALLNKSDSDALLFSDSLDRTVPDLLEGCPRIGLVAKMTMYRRNQDDSLNLTDLLESGRALLRQGDHRYEKAETDPEAMCAILFTSGTTGANKGVMLSQRNLTTVVFGAFSLYRFPSVSMSVLPIHHSYEFNLHVLGCIYGGLTLCFNDSLMHVGKNLLEFRPGMSLMVPMIVESLQKSIWREATRGHLDKHLRYGLWYSNLIRKIGIDARRYFFKPILKNFGGNLKMIVSGAAPLNPVVAKEMSDMGITVYNGYGITECAPLISANCPRLNVPGSVGIPIPGIEIRIVEPDSEGNGEIQVRGDNVMLGYYNDSVATEQTFTADGWFKTGDLGHIGRREALFVTGRKKNLIILPNGKNVQPEELEELMCNNLDYLKEVVVHQGFNKAGGEIIVASGYLEPDYVERVGKQSAHTQFQTDVARLNQRVVAYKHIQKVVVCDEEFQKTSTRKIKRHTYPGVSQ